MKFTYIICWVIRNLAIKNQKDIFNIPKVIEQNLRQLLKQYDILYSSKEFHNKTISTISNLPELLLNN